MSKAYIFLADGFEEIEGLTVVDVFRRGGVDTTTVSINKTDTITGSHKIVLKCDAIYENVDFSDGDILVLPGGLQGTNALMAHEELRDLLMEYRDANKYISAICAAPSVLGMNGLLKGKKATCYPGFEDKLLGATPTGARVEVDGNIITGKGMGTALDFALKLLEVLEGKEVSDKVAKSIQY